MKLIAERIINNIGTIHFIGIGGIGMSGIAEILHNLGYKVQGSDTKSNYNTKRLTNQGIQVFIKHQCSNITDATIIVKSSAINENNPEIVAAKARNLQIIKRSEMLAELVRLKISIAIAGTHGKTTTTSLVANMFESAGLSPTVINGGIINTHGTNAYLGKGDFLIAEADESDATFIKIPATIGIITNIDPEHLDYYGNFENLKEAFRLFIENLPFYGFGVLCIDHPEVAKLSNNISDRKILTYGIESEFADFRAINICYLANGSNYDLAIRERHTNSISYLRDINLPMLGRHNILNSLAAIAVAYELKFPLDVIKQGFENFLGVKRRFTITGIVDDIKVIDDYAHHPAEIIATIATARLLKQQQNNQLIIVIQPHRYSRISDLFSEFIHSTKEADIIIFTDIYSAGEQPIVGITKEILATATKQLNPAKQVITVDDFEQLVNLINKLAKSDDLVLLMGAGDITDWANKLPAKLKKLRYHI